MATLEETATHRVRIEYDNDAQAPTNCGMAPTLRLDYGTHGGYYYGYHAEPFDADNEVAPGADDSAAMCDVLARFNEGAYDVLGAFKRYLVIFRNVDPRHIWEIAGNRNSYGYLSYATPEWITACGITDLDRLAEENMLSEVQAWIDGDVYGVIVEQRRTFTKTYSDGTTETGEEWDEVEAVWGYYGEEWAAIAAHDALESYSND